MQWYAYEHATQNPTKLDVTFSTGAPAVGQAFRLRAIEKYFVPIFDNITDKIIKVGQYIRGMIKGKKRYIGGQCARPLSS